MNVNSTPSLYLNVDGVTFDGTEKVTVFFQHPDGMIVKTGTGLTVDGSSVLVHFEQRETCRMRRGKAKIQIKVQESDGYVWYTAKKLVDIKDVLRGLYE